MTGSPQALSLADRRLVAAWAADCAERVLPAFERIAPGDDRPRDAIDRARAFSRGDLDAAGEIRRRFVAGRAAGAVDDRTAKDAARSAAQASGVAHMGAHALGAAAYAVRAAGPDEVEWQLAHLDEPTRVALAALPALGTSTSGPLGPGLLSSGALGATIRRLQTAIGIAGTPPGIA